MPDEAGEDKFQNGGAYQAIFNINQYFITSSFLWNTTAVSNEYWAPAKTLFSISARGRLCYTSSYTTPLPLQPTSFDTYIPATR